MLTSQTGALLRDKSEHSQRKAPPTSPSLMINEQACKRPWNMEVTRQCHKPIRLNCVQCLWFLWVHAGMSVSLCVYPKKNECCKAITSLKWWPNYDSLLQHAALQNQTPWNWLPAHLDLICDSTLPYHWLSAGPCSIPTEQKINALKMHTCKIMGY